MRGRRRWQLPLLALLASSGIATAEIIPEPELPGWQHRRWTSIDGAPGLVFAMAQTPDGYLWLAAATGLYRFDGLRFDRMPPSKAGFAKSQTVRSLLVAANGDLYVGHDFGGVSRVRHNSYESIGQQLDNGTIYSLIQLPDASVIALLDPRIPNNAWLLRGNRWSPFRLLRDTASVPRQYMVDRTGTVWVLVDEKVIAVPIKDGRAGPDIAAPSLPTATLMRNSDGMVMIADGSTLRNLELDRSTAQIRQGKVRARLPGMTRPQHAVASGSSALWSLGAESGLARFEWDGRHEAARLLGRARHANGATVFPTAILVDRESILWIATSSGLSQFRPVAIQSRTPVPNALNFLPWSYHVQRDGNGDVFVLEGRRLSRVTAEGGLRTVVEALPASSPVCRSAGSGVWVSDGRKFRTVGTDASRSLPFPTWLPTNEPLLACDEGKDRNFWLSGGRPGITALSDRGAQTVSLPGSPNAYALALEHDSAGNLLAYRGNSRLWRLDAGHLNTIWHDPAKHLEFVEFIYPDDQFTYFGGPNGLARYDGKNIRVLNASRSPALSFLSGMVRTQAGDTWLHGANGLFRIRSEQLDRAFREPGYRPTVEHFGVANGLIAEPLFQSRSSLAEDRWGRIWIVTATGIAMIDPARVPRNTIAPPTHIVSLSADDRDVPLRGRIVLPPGIKQIRIAYVGLSLALPESNRYRYRLLGVEEEWVDAGPRREAGYGNLKPGQYVFEVMATNNDGVWSVTPASVEFSIEPAFYQTWWFLTASAIVGLGLLFVVFRIRMNRIALQLRRSFQLRLNERERIARELHDTLLQTVHGLMLHMRAAISRLGSSDPSREELKRALDVADVAVAEARDRIAGLRDNSLDLDLNTYLRNLVEGAGREMPFTLSYVGPEKPRNVRPSVSSELIAVVNESLANVSRHARAASVEIAVVCSWHEMVLTIRDDGIGIPSEIAAGGMRAGHYGLLGMRERVASLCGRLTIRNRSTGGTEVRVKLSGFEAYRWGLARDARS